MPYTKEHKRKSRERILHSASRLFSRRGYNAVSLDDVMADAGLTRGAFYNHFRNKADLYAQAIPHAAMNNEIGKDLVTREPTRESLDCLVERYLSREHIEDADPPCPLAFLATDVGIRDEGVRNAYTRMHGELARLLRRVVSEGGTDAAHDDALAVTALLIGGVAVGRALNDPDAVEALLTSCRGAARKLLASPPNPVSRD